MDVNEARRIVVVAAGAWAAEKLAYEEIKFLTEGYPPNLDNRRERLNTERALGLRTEVFDAAVVQLAREIAREEQAETARTT